MTSASTTSDLRNDSGDGCGWHEEYLGYDQISQVNQGLPFDDRLYFFYGFKPGSEVRLGFHHAQPDQEHLRQAENHPSAQLTKIMILSQCVAQFFACQTALIAA